MEEIKRCPFKLVKIVSPGYEGWANLIHTESQIPIAMMHAVHVPEMEELIAAWNTRAGMGIEDAEMLVQQLCHWHNKFEQSLRDEYYPISPEECEVMRNSFKSRIISLLTGRE